MPRRKDPRIPDAVLDQLLAGADPKTVFDPNGLLDDRKRPWRNEFSTPRWTIISPATERATGEMVMARRRSSPIPARPCHDTEPRRQLVIHPRRPRRAWEVPVDPRGRAAVALSRRPNRSGDCRGAFVAPSLVRALRDARGALLWTSGTTPLCRRHGKSR